MDGSEVPAQQWWEDALEDAAVGQGGHGGGEEAGVGVFLQWVLMLVPNQVGLTSPHFFTLSSAVTS